jgi:hypothetical protein
MRKSEPWKRCPSTHCERAQECRSPSECAAVGPSREIQAIDNYLDWCAENNKPTSGRAIVAFLADNGIRVVAD